MAAWQRRLLGLTGILLLAAWPWRWVVMQAFPTDLVSVQGGGAWPLHLLAETITAVLCLWASANKAPRPVRLLALGTLGYGMINGLSYGIFGDSLQLLLALLKLAAFSLAVPGGPGEGTAPGPRWAGGLIALLGFGMIAFWTLQVLSGMFTNGLLTAEGNAYLIYHVTAELLAGLTALIGGVAVLRQRPVSLALVGAGGVLYAAVNSLGWAVLNDAALSMIFVATSLAVLVATWGLWHAAANSRRPGTAGYRSAPIG